jgi:hypothetical protein
LIRNHAGLDEQKIGRFTISSPGEPVAGLTKPNPGKTRVKMPANQDPCLDNSSSAYQPVSTGLIVLARRLTRRVHVETIPDLIVNVHHQAWSS